MRAAASALGRRLPQRGDMLARPRLPPIDLGLENARHSATVVKHRHRQPLRPALRLDVVSLTPPMLVVLHIVVIDEHVGAGHLVEEAEPWQVSGLQYDKRASGARRLWGSTPVR